ncbi:methyltransferase domain-containing protein [Candidatus Woesearchaeota archaeon]|nr:methyltransferase domain-containing protein [Candidatus Woesearchaeota archaeon]
MVHQLIAKETEWNRVSKELKTEQLKLVSYDNTLIPLIGKIKLKKMLDYGGGPGVLSLALKKLGADVKEYDLSDDMRNQAAQKIGKKNIYNTIEKIPQNYFDIVICNLVLCIVSEEEVKRILKNIKQLLNAHGFAYIGFCNPKLLNVPETQLDLRPAPKHKYTENHSYIKTKKEGGYQIIENHRPIKWYEKMYKDTGLKLVDTIYTPKYEFKERKIKDFIIFKLKKI